MMMMLLSYVDHHHVLEGVVVLPLQSLYLRKVLLQPLQHVHIQEFESYIFRNSNPTSLGIRILLLRIV